VKTLERIEIRPIQNRDELEVCIDLWATVFPENQAFFQERLDFDPSYSEETTWLAKVNEKIVAAVQIFPYYTSLDGLRLKVGGIGNVATLPEYRGRSLTQLILQRQSEWMARNGYDLSLLFTGINQFYEKVGWETVPHTSYTLDAQKGLKVVQTILGLEPSYTVKPYEPIFLDQIKEVHESFITSYFGPTIRTPDYWTGQLKWLNEEPGEFLVALDKDQAVAYLRVKKRDATIEITEGCYKAEHESALFSLVEEVLIKEPDCKRLRGAVPRNHALYSFFVEAGAEAAEETYAMWKILNVPLLFTKLREVFSKRLQEHPLEAVHALQSPILIQSGGKEILLKINNGFVDVQPPTDILKYQLLYKRKPADLLSDLINGVPSDHPTIKTLFPLNDYLFWKTDSF
jgi:predicted acetyltransferase